MDKHIVLIILGCQNKLPYTEGLNNQNLFLSVLEAGRSTIKALADSVSSEGSLPGLQMADGVLTWQREVSSYKETNNWIGAPLHDLI
jgi:hypothetical protein